MPTLTLYHLEPKGPFHFGRRGIELEETGYHFPSDSFFAALVAAWVETGYALESLTGQFPHYPPSSGSEPPFLLTSLFPRAGEVRFYPAPPLSLLLSPEKLGALHQAHRLKEVKKIKFISEALFEKVCTGHWLDGYVPSAGHPQPTDQGAYMQESDLWLTQEELKRLPPAMQAVPRDGNLLKAVRATKVWQTDKVPRVTIDRISNASNIFHAGRLSFGPGCGFWLGIEWRKPDAPLTGAETAIRQAVYHTLDLLADSGLGAERNAGYGSFAWKEARTKSLPAPTPGGLFITLSRYHPQEIELPAIFQDERAAYSLVSVAGWLQTPAAEAAQRRRRVWFFAEGSVLKMPVADKILGDIVDVRPKYETNTFTHAVFRYGLALAIGLGGVG